MVERCSLHSFHNSYSWLSVSIRLQLQFVKPVTSEAKVYLVHHKSGYPASAAKVTQQLSTLVVIGYLGVKKQEHVLLPHWSSF